MSDLKQHELSAAYPSMPGHEVDELAADIKAHGLRQPITLFEGQVLDGWHRYRACEIAGVPIRAVEFPADGDPVAHVESMNDRRRHLSESQRAMSAVRISKYREAAGRPNGNAATLPDSSQSPLTNAELAEKAHVSERTIRSAKVAHKAGLGDAVRDGVVSVNRAAEIVRTEPKTAKKIASAVAKGDLPAAEKIAKADKPLPHILPRKVPPPREPAPEKKPAGCEACAAHLARIAELESDYTELSDNRQELADLLEAYTTVEEGTEAVAKEIVKLKGQLKVAHTRRDGLMTENNELKKTVKAAQARMKRLETQVETLTAKLEKKSA